MILCCRGDRMERITVALLLSLVQLAVGQCPEPNGYFAHDSYCDMFVDCRNGTMREGVCPDGLVFDDRVPSRYLRCELPFDIDCSYRPSLQPAQPTDHCPRKWGLYAHETNCNRFWNCVEGHAYGFVCPEGLAYNEYMAHCDWPDQVERCNGEEIVGFTCPPATAEEINEFGDPRYPHPTDCRKHYVCILGHDERRRPRLLACDPGLVFNSVTSSCDEPENVRGCENYYDNLDPKRIRELFGRR